MGRQDPRPLGFPRRRAPALAALAFALGCGTLAGTGLPAGEDGGRVELVEVPFYPQEQGHCGAAALAAVLGWSGDPVSPGELDAYVFSPGRDGSLQSDMVSAARRRGRVAVPISSPEALVRELRAGAPVLVLQNLGLSWWEQWHWAVAIGVDPERGTVLLRSGSQARREVSFATFDRTWARGERFGLLVLPPERLPASGDELSYLRAVAGLEGAGRPAQAERAYATALERWPSSLGARIGLGNTRHAQGDLEGAASAFETAAAEHTRSYAAHHNLAETLTALGDHERAARAAERARALRP